MKTKKRKKKNKKKEKRKERKRKENEEKPKWKKNQVVGENQSMWERKRKGERGKENIFPVFRRSELDSPRAKVGPHNESYAWVPKSEFFVEAPRGRGFLLNWFLFT